LQISPSNGTSSNTGAKIYNVHIIDPGEQAVKINDNTAGFPDNGEIACSTIELTDTGRNQIETWDNNPASDPRQLDIKCYTGGVDGHKAKDWSIRDNVIKGFWCNTGLSEHGVHFWSGSRNINVERNLFINNARGVGLGLGDSRPGSRTYTDSPCPGVAAYVGSYGGVIKNNMIIGNDPRLFASPAQQDTGIALESACETKVIHNTVASTQVNGYSSIEWRFLGSANNTISNNLTTYRIIDRGSGSGNIQEGNRDLVSPSIFVNLMQNDAHLNTTALSALGQGVLKPEYKSLAPTDFDMQERFPASNPNRNPDIGADQKY